MKIRLTVTAPNGQSRTFEHAGPSVRIGRDPDFELCLEGDEADLCSTRHARIDLTPDGATLTDTGSTNHTLHNDEEMPANAPARLKAGDRIQIGYTGSKLVVLSLDLSSGRAVPLPKSHRVSNLPRVLLLGGAAVAAGLLLGVTVLFVMKKGKGAEQVAVGPPSHKDMEQEKEKDREERERKERERKEREEKERKEKEKKETPPEAVVQKVGTYIRAPKVQTSVLVERDPTTQRWYVLKSGQEVQTGRTFVSLPGYQSLIYLDKGVKVNLWGNVPEFWLLPVRESIVLFNPPPDRFDAELLLERGRVELECVSPTNKSVVRLKMSGQTWDITLEGKGSKACVDHVYHVDPVAAGPAIRLYSHGNVAVKTGREEASLGKNGYVAWASWADKLYRDTLKEPPEWWRGDPKLTQGTLETAVLLQDWAELFDKEPHEVLARIDGVLTDTTKDLPLRKLGLMFLAALDETAILVQCGLNDQTQGSAQLRGVAKDYFQDWLARDSSRKEMLLRELKRLRVSDATASVIVSLMVPLPNKALDDPATYQQLIDYLDHPDVRVRNLAHWHLYVDLVMRKRLPEPRKDDDYEPASLEAKRKEAVKRWRKAVPPGTVPRG
jgi:pSer/pThr/pTyr-binding forkhead associated (FHA) protein